MAIAAINVVPIQGFPILAPQVLDAAFNSASADTFPAGRIASEGFHRHAYHQRRHHGVPEFAPRARLARNGELLEALIAQMGGSATPSGKGIYIDIRV